MPGVKNVLLSIFLSWNQNRILQKDEQGCQNLTVLKRSTIIFNRSSSREECLLLITGILSQGIQILSDLLSHLILLYVSKFLNSEVRNKGKIHTY